MRAPDYDGGSLVNLSASIEIALTGQAPLPDLRGAAGDFSGYEGIVLLLFDGLGTHQLSHPALRSLTDHHVSTIDTVFASSTTTALASLVTGLPPAGHGVLSHELWMADRQLAANTIHWTEVASGRALTIDHFSILPPDNLWERLGAAGVEAITVQPLAFDGSPMTTMLYRGARFEGVSTIGEMVDATVDLAGPGRFVFAYFAGIDVAAHRTGQRSSEYTDALVTAAEMWERLALRLPADVGLVGTADHGHIDASRLIELPRDLEAATVAYGDGRVIFTRDDASRWAPALEATWVPGVELEPMFGPGPLHPATPDRMPAGGLFAGGTTRLLHRHANPRLIGCHGGVSDAEMSVPVLRR